MSSPEPGSGRRWRRFQPRSAVGRAGERAVALRYEEGLPAPFLVAKGSGRSAERLRAVAERAGVPVLRDGALADALYPLDVGAFVPEEYYGIVARVFAFVRAVEEA